MLEPGDAIDQWVVERRLGAGGMGSVYQCRSRSAARIRAAVKVLDARLDRSDAARKRFVREAEILYALDHPNIVRVQSVRLDTDPPHLTMEFVDGESLDHRLQRGAVPLDEALPVMRQIADAIAHLHARGIRHRDLKPANVVVQADGIAKIVDFGIALEIDATRLTNEGARFGTPGYAPPEWLGNDATDPAQWDLYALGVCFYELLTGAVAFPVNGELPPQQQILQVMLAKQAKPHLDPGPSFPTPLRGLVRELTSANPADRPDAATVVARLHPLEAPTGAAASSALAPTVRDNSTLWEDAAAEADATIPPAQAPTVEAVGAPTLATPTAPPPQGLSPALLAAVGLAALVAAGAAALWVVGAEPTEPREAVPPVAETAPAADPAPVAPVVTEAAPAADDAVAIALEPPPPEPVETAPPPPKAAAAPPPAEKPRGTGHVTAASFARWLEAHPEWAPEPAQAAGRADAAYLADWRDEQPPAGAGARPVTGVGWLAAAAYCETRGGLLPLDAEPLDWADGDGPYIEWRVAEGRPAWRSAVGQASTAVTAKESNPVAGFRCAR